MPITEAQIKEALEYPDAVMVCWVEPFTSTGKPVFMRAPISTVIEHEKQRAAQLNVPPLSDAQAVEEFLVCSWGNLDTRAVGPLRAAKQNREAFDLGRADWKNNIPLIQNPYSRGTTEYDSWVDGWKKEWWDNGKHTWRASR